MICVIVSYPNQEGSKFDMDYYLNKHMPMLEEKLKPHGLQGAWVQTGMSGGMPGSPAKYQVQCFLNYASVEGMQAGMMAEGVGIMKDIANFTDVRPDIQVNQVLR